jgi:hypothetical protein
MCARHLGDEAQCILHEGRDLLVVAQLEHAPIEVPLSQRAGAAAVRAAVVHALGS